MDLIRLDIASVTADGIGVSRVKSAPLPILYPLSDRSWFPLIREPSTGAWQTNQEVRADCALRHPTVYACVTLIASDIAKMCPTLMLATESGIAEETVNPAYSPVLRDPNHYQTHVQFKYWWMVSKLSWGNTYALKQRDNRGVVTDLYVLDPCRVRPLVAPDGSVYYQLDRDWLSGVIEDVVTVPASEVIHDPMDPLFHPLCGIPPLYAAGTAAQHGLSIQSSSNTFFSNGSQPGGVLTSPGVIPQDVANRIKDYWDTNFTGDNAGKVAVLGNGLQYQALGLKTANESQLVEQLNWTDEKICSAFHVPPHKVGVGDQPNYNNIEALNRQYYSECLQKLIVGWQALMNRGLELRSGYEIRLDLNDLLMMDTATKTKAASDGVRGGFWSPNEARELFDLPPVPGGDTPYLQQQDYSLSALDRRDQSGPAPSSVGGGSGTGQPSAVSPPDPTSKGTEDLQNVQAFFRKMLTA